MTFRIPAFELSSTFAYVSAALTASGFDDYNGILEDVRDVRVDC